MITKIFAIYDSKAEAYLPFFVLPSKGEAIRALTELVNDDKHQFGKHAEDYTLFELGSWDNLNCKFSLHTTPFSLGVLLEYKKGNSSVL